MNKKLIIYSLLLGLLAILLKIAEYKFVVIDNETELYAGFVALLFTGIGIWTGKKLAGSRIKNKDEAEGISNFELNLILVDNFGISKREQEILALLAEGLSNQEISDKVFLSIHTIKSHVSNLYSKLEVKSRTQAIKKAKDYQLIS